MNRAERVAAQVEAQVHDVLCSADWVAPADYPLFVADIRVAYARGYADGVMETPLKDSPGGSSLRGWA